MIVSERPIENSEEDAFEREKFVLRLCNALVDKGTNTSTGAIVGLTGPWGSGKSSILNLLHSKISEGDMYNGAIVLRFDPWLVSGHNDLIAQFLADLAALIKRVPSLGERAEKLASVLTTYGAHLAPIANLYTPGLGLVFGGGIKSVKSALERDRSLQGQRREIEELLQSVGMPIVVLIDELDRVEDSEIRSIAQLVRAVADFPRISYLLAYDPRRVVHALGEGNEEYGKSYLEKIVQHQIPLPISYDDELLRLLDPVLDELAADGAIPQNWQTIERFRELTRIVIPRIVSTPRDIVRLSGSFRILEAMLRGEVDWVDLLGYCCLLTKAPDIDHKIRNDPDLVCDNPTSRSALKFRLSYNDVKRNELIEFLVGENENKENIVYLLGFLFPCLDEASASTNDNSDAIYLRDRLLTTLRLDLLPGRFSRREVKSLLHSDRVDIAGFVRASATDRRLGQFVDRLHDVFFDIGGIDHVSLWLGFSIGLRKEPPEWDTQFNPVKNVPENLVRLFERSVLRDFYSQTEARNIFNELVVANDVLLTSLIVRTHINAFGSFTVKQEDRDGRAVFIEKEELEHLVPSLCREYRQAHLDGNWLATLYDFNPVYTMVDTGLWDQACKERITEMMENNSAVVGLSIVLFGGSYGHDRSVLEDILDVDHYKARIRQVMQLEETASLHPTAIDALNKANSSLGRN